jgi:hypothetical protein
MTNPTSNKGPDVNTASLHHIDCPWQLDQYPWECTCGATAAKAEIERLRAALDAAERENEMLRDLNVTLTNAAERALGTDEQ